MLPADVEIFVMEEVLL